MTGIVQAGRALALVGLATFIVASVAINARATYGAQVTADEPQYLLTALSLAEDVDLDISDELADERFRPFHEVALNPQTIDLNDDGQRLSPHDPLLPLLLAPAMGAGGWVGAKLMLAAIGALTAVATTWLAIRRFCVPTGTAALVVGGLFCAPPLTSYATQVYPEMPAALAVVVAVIALTGRRSPGWWAVVVGCIVALPWLAVKYVPVAAVLAGFLVVAVLEPQARRLRTLSLIGAVLAVAGLIYVVVHQRVYGGWTVYAAGDHFVDGEFGVVGRDPDYAGRTRRLLGLLVDRQFGLAAWTPAYVLAAPAAAAAVRLRLPHRWLLVSLIGVAWATATWVALTMQGWWWPGRQVVVVLPLVAVMIAAVVQDRPRVRAATLVGVALGVATWAWLVFEASTGRRTLVVDFAETANPWYALWSRLLPDHGAYAVTGADLALTAFWAALLLIGAVALATSRPGRHLSTQPAASPPTSDTAASVSAESGSAAIVASD